MRPIRRIDFIEPHGASRAALALLLLAGALLAWQGWLAWQGQQALQTDRATLAAVTRQAAAPLPSASPEQRREWARIEQLAGHFAAPWDELLAAFEEHGAGRVALVRLEPDAATGIVHLLARARQPRAMMDYVTALEADARLASVLLNHHELLRDVPGTPVEFAVSAVWRVELARRAPALTPALSHLREREPDIPAPSPRYAGERVGVRGMP